MARQVNHLSDIPSTKKYGSKHGGRKFHRYEWNWGRDAKRGLRKTAKKLKRQGQISHYRIETYENVLITTGNKGRVDNRRKPVHVLYVRR